MTATARRILRGMLAVVYLYIVLTTGLIVWGVWALAIDTTPPIADLRGRLVSYDPDNRVALIEWTGTRARFCPGETRPQLRDGQIIDLEPGVISGMGGVDDTIEQGRRPGSTGYPVSWRREIKIPDDVGGVVRYSLTFLYHCNPLQALMPLVVQPADVEIPVGGETIPMREGVGFGSGNG